MLHEVRHPDFYAFITLASLPAVLCTFSSETRGFYSVHIDEAAAARTATEYLIELGHRRIGLISGTHFSFAAQRTAGYRAALEAAGIEYDEVRIISASSYGIEEGRVSMRKMLQQSGDLTAVFAITDELAIGAMRAFHEAGLSAPRNISIIGLDDIDIAAFFVPGLSTMRQPIREMGRKTAEIMYRMIAGDDSGDRSLVFPHELVIRESCRAI
jgi:LacI family transcriptional regulator